MGWMEWTLVRWDIKRKFTLRKGNFFVIAKHIEEVKQDGKSVPDLLEAMMGSPGLAKEQKNSYEL